MHAEAPGELQGRATREHHENTRGRYLVDQEREQFQGRRVYPVEVFDDQEHRLLLGERPHQEQERIESVLPLLRRQWTSRIALGWQRQRQERGHQGYRLGERQVRLCQERLELLERSAQRLPRPPLEPALEELGDGIPGSVLVVGQAPALETH